MYSGMFLWARLVLDYLSTNIFFSGREVREAVDLLPIKLSEFYARILSQLTSRFDQRSVERLRSILGWIAFAKRPLTRGEIRSALAFGQGDHTVEEPVPRYIFDLGAPLLEEHPDTAFSFVHISVKEYLQTPGCILFLDQLAATCEHATATITCLISGLWVFSGNLADDTRINLIVKGLYGLHIYANHFWLEYLLDAVSTASRLVKGSPLYRAAQELANTLSVQSGIQTYPTPGTHESTTSRDTRLQFLEEHKAIYVMVRKELGERTNHSKLPKNGDKVTLTASSLRPPKDFQSLLLAMQSSIRHVLALSTIPGVLPEDLDRFKNEFRTSAFTCRFPNFSRAALRFNDEKLQSAHETGHTQRINCVILGCQYPPFASTRALRDHVSRCHQTQNAIRKRIKRTSGGKLSSEPVIQKMPALTSMADFYPGSTSYPHPPPPPLLLTSWPAPYLADPPTSRLWPPSISLSDINKEYSVINFSFFEPQPNDIIPQDQAHGQSNQGTLGDYIGRSLLTLRGTSEDPSQEEEDLLQEWKTVNEEISSHIQPTESQVDENEVISDKEDPRDQSLWYGLSAWNDEVSTEESRHMELKEFDN
ncbi:hypothetical protein SMACR_12714 [Sordaria macrospora]|uniref:WGS project CABT00000000 data, contig 2.1 n=2 Tax=Sordaria macrospora TaxID=5147 RepID=F7VLH7_SORMK|nr:uncharacterized protein SMAC_12714 [Sordaria macrospora k-hell]KAA8635475.1 hypothetical protein SMACR_12714 [Sordaria macrospora]WPJ59321.1 hypothetical protein SMAC4_12714 [Sordaria macrospora]CCC06355.1 unnamed protein product [Sordaria macrospora k-hell]